MKNRRVQSWLQEFNEFTSTEQIEALNELKKLYLEPADLNYLYSAKKSFPSERNVILGHKKLGRVNFITELSAELQFEIFSYLNGFSLLRCELVAKLWLKTLRSETFDELYEKDYRRLFSTSTHLLDLHLRSKKNKSKKLGRILWNKLLKSRKIWYTFQDEMSEKRVIRSELKGHEDRIRHVRVKGKKFVSASWDGSVRLGSCDITDTKQETREIIRHSASVFGIWFNGEIIASCSEDHSILVFDVEQNKLISKLKAHQGPVYRVDFLRLGNSYEETYLVSCSSDFIGVWNWQKSILIEKLYGHKHDVHRLQVHKNSIVSGSYDQTIRIWNVEKIQNDKSKEIMCSLVFVSEACHSGGVSALFCSSNFIGTGSAQGEIFIFDIQKRKKIFQNNNSNHIFSAVRQKNYRRFSNRRNQLLSRRAQQSRNIVTCVFLDEPLDLFICSSIESLSTGGGQVCFWSIETGRLLGKIKQASYINSLKYEYGLLFTAESDGYIRVRDSNCFYPRIDYPEEVDMEEKLVCEEKLSSSQLFDIDVQGSNLVACGLEKVYLLQCFL
eukprot:snap_masked-scaffold_26-processed-gene-1.40-mRNA-1 protein AED:1.00 eAED:1.00 QI:0/-1/0/0/-1/1/1/0/554